MKHVLVVSAFFPPAAFIGSQRPLKLVREIGRFGWRASVLTVAERCSGLIDNDSVSRIPRDVKVARTACWSYWNHSLSWRDSRGGVRRIAAMASRAAARITWGLLPTDQYWPWSHAAVGAGVALIRRHNADVIWATSPSLSALTLARRLSRRTGVPYVVDFRDVRNAPDRSAPRYERNAHKQEWLVLRDCAAITYVAPDQISVLRGKHPDIAPRVRSELVYNWFDAAEAVDAEPIQFNAPTILHGGILYGGTRRLDGFMEALAIARRSDSATARRLRFLQLGGLPLDGGYVRDLARRFSVTGAVELKAAAPHSEFVRMCKGALGLLLVVGNDSGAQRHSGAIPGKLYNYFAAQKPILVIGPDGCEAGRMVREVNRGLVARDDRPEEIAAALTRLCREGEGGDAFDMHPEALAPYSAETCLGRLASLLDQVRSSRA